VFATNSDERVRISSNGYVGIGTAIPAAKLDVNGGASGGQLLRMSSSGNDPLWRLTDGTMTVLAQITVSPRVGQIGTESDHVFRIVTNNIARMTFATSGNVEVNGGNLFVYGDVLPEADNTRNIGSNGLKYNTAYVNTIGNNLSIIGNVSNTGVVISSGIGQSYFGGDVKVNGNLLLNTSTRYYQVSSFEFNPVYSTTGHDFSNLGLQNKAGELSSSSFFCGIHLPNGAIIISFKAFWYRDDASATGNCNLLRHDFSSNSSGIATANSNVSTGYHNVEDTTITNGTIDNTSYSYYCKVDLDPNDSAADVFFTGVVITYIITSPLP
jgi:hypothetical protein